MHCYYSIVSVSLRYCIASNNFGVGSGTSFTMVVLVANTKRENKLECEIIGYTRLPLEYYFNNTNILQMPSTYFHIARSNNISRIAI